VLAKEKLQAEIQQRRKVLIVDDSELQRKILLEYLEESGFEVLIAKNGKEGIKCYKEGSPDIVLMDVEMPEMDGLEATRRIRKMMGGHHIPIIFTTALNNDKQLEACIDVGGDDFIAKPINPVVLKAKIKSLLRMNDLIVDQAKQKEDLLNTQNETLREQEVAAEIFGKIVHEGSLDVPNIKHLLSPMSLFNGDLLLAAHTPTGQLQILLGDFTGHGLIASIGAGPAAEIFYGMTAKGFGVEEIIPEINKKMCKVLPTGMFLAACLISFDKQQGLLSIFTGGLPDHLLFSKDSEEVERITSSNLPLGIIDNEQMDFVFDHLEVNADQRLYLFTDGIIETRNKNGKEAGIEGVEWCLLNPIIEGDGFNSILESHERFAGSSAQEDDLTLIEVDFDPSLAVSEEHGVIQKAKKPTAWKTSMTLGAGALKSTNPVPMIVNQIMELQGLQSYREAIYTIMTELYVNALDHGLLGLDSSLKEDAEGFMHYFSLREERLEAFDMGQIKVSFKHQPTTSGGQLTILVQDSGSGFEIDTVVKNLEDNVGYSGRGIPLVKKLCSSLGYSDAGRRAKAVFDWEFTD
jgi:CheY-like chemotaxis protein